MLTLVKNRWQGISTSFKVYGAAAAAAHPSGFPKASSHVVAHNSQPSLDFQVADLLEATEDFRSFQCNPL